MFESMVYSVSETFIFDIKEQRYSIGSTEILKNVGFTSCSGDVLAIMGPSGKTLISVLNVLGLKHIKQNTF